MLTLKPYLILCRVYISFFAACSAATGFLLGPYQRLAEALVPAAAVFLLACGASALNQYQERSIDARMERTRRRPLPSGTITPARALSFALGLILAGLAMLSQTGGVKTFLLGLFALLWYNGIYTSLKRTTAFASVPGAVVGMIPPAIGWSSAGGPLFDARLAAVCFVFFMWQIPHFWLLLLHHGDEYKKAGLPSLFGVLSPAQISRVTFIWIFAASVAVLLLPLYGAVRSPLIYFALIPPAVWLVWNGRSLAKKGPMLSLSPGLFRKINIYLFLIMSLLSLDRIVSRMP
jgi:protoheme IX farnesyltransferase